MSQRIYRPNDLPGSSIDPRSRDGVSLRSGAYGYKPYDSIAGRSARPESSLGGLTAGMSKRSYDSLDDPIMMSRKRGGSMGRSPLPHLNTDVAYERLDSQPRVNGASLPPTESNILFVDGLPTNCTRREVGHIFRPFIGFKDIKVIHKEPRRNGDKATVLCFVEFNNSKCALLQWMLSKVTNLTIRNQTPPFYESVLRIFLFTCLLNMLILDLVVADGDKSWARRCTQLTVLSASRFMSLRCCDQSCKSLTIIFRSRFFFFFFLGGRRRLQNA